MRCTWDGTIQTSPAETMYAKTSTPTHERTRRTPAAGIPPPQRSGWRYLSVDAPHRHAHRECADLSSDCLRSTGPNQWAVHVPLGKLKTERMVPVDPFVCELVRRLRFFRSLDPLSVDGRLLARPRTKEALVRQLRDYLHQVCHALGLPTRIIPHKFRHSYASEMLRAGVSLPAVMKLLGHTSPEMTMRYLDIVLTDLQREFELARSKPRHLTPQPKARLASFPTGLDGVIDPLLAAQHVLEMFRRTLPNGTSRRGLDRLSNRLTKILSEARKLVTP
ncbi:MAG TPA: tyrosine-type recombinase/integrase [Candidatus Sulfotelmatobacter sp.]